MDVAVSEAQALALGELVLTRGQLEADWAHKAAAMAVHGLAISAEQAKTIWTRRMLRKQRRRRQRGGGGSGSGGSPAAGAGVAAASRAVAKCGRRRQLRPAESSTARVPIEALLDTEALSCPICMGILKNCATTIHCVHRFCSECIEKQLRLSRIKECPTCRKECPSRRYLRADPAMDSLIAAVFPDLAAYEVHEEERISELNATTSKRHAELLSNFQHLKEQQQRRARQAGRFGSAERVDSGASSSAAAAAASSQGGAPASPLPRLQAGAAVFLSNPSAKTVELSFRMGKEDGPLRWLSALVISVPAPSWVVVKLDDGDILYAPVKQMGHGKRWRIPRPPPPAAAPQDYSYGADADGELRSANLWDGYDSSYETFSD